MRSIRTMIHRPRRVLLEMPAPVQPNRKLVLETIRSQNRCRHSGALQLQGLVGAIASMLLRLALPIKVHLLSKVLDQVHPRDQVPTAHNYQHRRQRRLATRTIGTRRNWLLVVHPLPGLRHQVDLLQQHT